MQIDVSLDVETATVARHSWPGPYNLSVFQRACAQADVDGVA